MDDPQPDAQLSAVLQRLLEILKANLQQVSVMGEDGKERYRYYTCGQEHDPRNKEWKPFQHLMRYCQELGMNFMRLEIRSRRG